MGLRIGFHGMVVKFWIGDDFNNNYDRKCNKVIMKESVLFYSKCWLDRCKALHNEAKKITVKSMEQKCLEYDGKCRRV